MAGNKNLHAANKAKKDEFYTLIEDINDELRHYSEHFKDKVVFCNCDDPYESNFFKYFVLNFNRLGLKKLICTCFDGSPVAGIEYKLDLFEENRHLTTFENSKKIAHKIIISQVKDLNNDGAIDLNDIILMLKANENNEISTLKGTGDFRSNECVELLKQSDIVVTNPPFSLFREYVSLLIQYEKKFLIIGNVNAITYKEIFRYFKDNKLWIGYRFNKRVGGKNMTFRVPDDYEMKGTEQYIDGNGIKYISVSGTGWFTNLDHQKRHEELDLYKTYNKEDYPTYENYDAINIDVTADIPMDYKGIMGVPITYLDKYNPDQFEIIALGIVGSCSFTNERKMEILDKNGEPTGKFTINAKGTLYRKFNPIKDKKPAFKDAETGELYSSIYARILIKNKQL